MKKVYKTLALTLVSIMAFTLAIMVSSPGHGPDFMDNCPLWLRIGGGVTLLVIEGTHLTSILEKLNL